LPVDFSVGGDQSVPKDDSTSVSVGVSELPSADEVDEDGSFQ
jgi:hypothetical protein